MLFLQSFLLIVILNIPYGTSEDRARLCPSTPRDKRVFEDLQDFNYLAKYAKEVNEGDPKTNPCNIDKDGAYAEANRICVTHYGKLDRDKCLKCGTDYVDLFPMKPCRLNNLKVDETCNDFKRVSGNCLNEILLLSVLTFGYKKQSIAYELRNFAEDEALRICKEKYNKGMSLQRCKDCRYKLYSDIENRRTEDGVLTFNPTKAKTSCKSKFKSIRFTSCVLLRAKLWSTLLYKPIGDCKRLETSEAFKQAYDVCHGKLPRNHRSECYENGQKILDLIDEQSKYECETYLKNDCPY